MICLKSEISEQNDFSEIIWPDYTTGASFLGKSLSKKGDCAHFVSLVSFCAFN